MTTENTTQLTDYETANKPTSIKELDEGSPTTVLDVFPEVDPFGTTVTVTTKNRENDTYLVGRTVNGERGIYHLYHPPTDPNRTGYAGSLGKRTFPEPTVVGFDPSGEDATDETVAETVTGLTVTQRSEITELDAVLDTVKTELTGKDWTEDGRADTNWEDWNDAILTLMRFYEDHYDNPPYTITHEFMKGATMHAIARYPGDAQKVLSSSSMRLDRLEDSEDSSRYSVTPFSLERLLLDFADAECCIPHFDKSLP